MERGFLSDGTARAKVWRQKTACGVRGEGVVHRILSNWDLPNLDDEGVAEQAGGAEGMDCHRLPHGVAWLVGCHYVDDRN